MEALAHRWVISSGLQPVLQATVGNSLSFDPFSFCQNGWRPWKNAFCRGRRADLRSQIVAGVCE
jgi:hypothetical protein